MEKQMKTSTGNLELTPEQAEIEKLEVLEGADLRQLESFLKITDQARSLANLYRIVTYKGHVKWVCIDHYRENYQESAARQLQEFLDAYGGKFSQKEGKIKIEIESKSAAKQFYEAMTKTPRIQELDIKLGWDATLDDFRKLAVAVSKANIVRLEINDFPFDGPVLDAINSSRRFNPLVELMSNGRIQSMELRRLKNMESRISSSSFVTSSRVRALAISTPISMTFFSLILQNCTSLAELKIHISSPRDAIQEFARRASSSGNIKSLLIINISASVEFLLHQGCITNIKLSDTGRRYLDFIDALPVDQFNSLELNNSIEQDLKCLVEILRASTSLSSLSTPFADGASISDIKLIRQIRVEGPFEGTPYKSLLLTFRNPDPMVQCEGFAVTVQPPGTSGAADDEYAALLDEATNTDGCNLIILHLNTSNLSSAGMDSMDRVIARCLAKSLQRLGFTFVSSQDMEMCLLSKYGTLMHRLSISTLYLEYCIFELSDLFSAKQDLPVLDILSVDGSLDKSTLSKSSVEWLCSTISVPTLLPSSTSLDPEASATVPEIRCDIKPLRKILLLDIEMQADRWDTLFSSLDFLTLETLILNNCNFELVALERMVDSIPEGDDIMVSLKELDVSTPYMLFESDFEEITKKLKRKAPSVHIDFSI
ncbi:hypothetical protein BGZ99_000494 [Dissophora globulifera]|uniref:Uncharacterized protein n=1 Tax=Dissophora globulifera TaxID=979702 RepID=A0A9P6RY39_9FUNG|nr:hypothetical protein BGZ99_000494 [Dissophora globulifera]